MNLYSYKETGSKKDAPFAEIPSEEYTSRIEKALVLMEREGFSGLLLFNHRNVYYYSGYRRTVATVKVEGMLIPIGRPPVLLMPQLTSRYAGKATWIEDIRCYSGASHLNYSKTIVDLTVQTLRDLGLDRGLIGMELGGEIYPDITFNEIQAIMQALPRARFVDASPLIWSQRKIKSRFEQEILRQVGHIALKGFHAGLRSLREGMTEAELSRIVWEAWMKEGISDTPMEGQLLIRTGSRLEGPDERYPCSHARPTSYPIRKGETVLLDAGPSLRGYCADLMRQGCIGPPSDTLRVLFDTALVGYRRGVEMLKPGIKIGEICQRALGEMVKYNPQIQYPLSFLGHSLGLTIHEPPWFRAEEASVLEPGMVINFEIGAYDLPRWRTLGGFLEDMFLITENGSENLTEEGSMTLWVSEETI